MSEKLNDLQIPENRFWGTAALFPTMAIVVAILWWKLLTREEKVRLLDPVACYVLICVLNIIPILGQIASIVWVVFWVISVVKKYKGEDYQIPLAHQITEAIIKN